MSRIRNTVRDLRLPIRGRAVPHEPLHDPLESLGIARSEYTRASGIHIQHSEKRTVCVGYRYDDLRPCPRIAGDVPGKLMHIRNDYRAALSSCCSTDTAAKRDLETPERALIRSHTQ